MLVNYKKYQCSDPAEVVSLVGETHIDKYTPFPLYFTSKDKSKEIISDLVQEKHKFSLFQPEYEELVLKDYNYKVLSLLSIDKLYHLVRTESLKDNLDVFLLDIKDEDWDKYILNNAIYSGGVIFTSENKIYDRRYNRIRGPNRESDILYHKDWLVDRIVNSYNLCIALGDYSKELFIARVKTILRVIRKEKRNIMEEYDQELTESTVQPLSLEEYGENNPEIVILPPKPIITKGGNFIISCSNVLDNLGIIYLLSKCFHWITLVKPFTSEMGQRYLICKHCKADNIVKFYNNKINIDTPNKVSENFLLWITFVENKILEKENKKIKLFLSKNLGKSKKEPRRDFIPTLRYWSGFN